MSSKRYHYVYRITNTLENKHYYGKRSTDNEPIKDLGIKYFSSSTDKEFKRDQKHNPQNYKYKVIRLFESKNDAVNFEIKLQRKFNVSTNDRFYNKAIQTSSFFDVTGTTFTNEHKQKISQASAGENNAMYGMRGEKHPRFGLKHTEESKLRMSESAKGKIISDEARLNMSKAHLGRKHTEETKVKISIAKSGENHPFFDIPKEQHPMFGKNHSDKAKRAISEKNTGKVRIRVECPYCHRSFAKNMYVKYHGEKCKMK